MKIKFLEGLVVLDLVFLFFIAPWFSFPEMRNPHFWNNALVLDIGLLGFGCTVLLLWCGQCPPKRFPLLAVWPAGAVGLGLWGMFVY